MPVDRYFLDSPLVAGTTVSLSDTEFHHMVHVARLQVGQEVELVNGCGFLARSLLQEVQKKKAFLTIRSLEQQPKPIHPLILAQALPRLNRLDTILEKVTELGATDIWLFPATLSERKSLTEHQIQRLQAILIAALKQCGRLWLPKLEFKPALKEWSKLDYPCFFGDVNQEAPPLVQAVTKDKGALILIGPESGLSEAEEAHLRSLNFQGVKLSANILRTDTAAILAVGLISQLV